MPVATLKPLAALAPFVSVDPGAQNGVRGYKIADDRLRPCDYFAMRNHRIMEFVHAYLQSVLEDETEYSSYREYLQAEAYQIEEDLPYEEREKLEATGDSVATWLDLIDVGTLVAVPNDLKLSRDEGQMSASFIKDLERLADLRGG
jgi:hypothetical protein